MLESKRKYNRKYYEQKKEVSFKPIAVHKRIRTLTDKEFKTLLPSWNKIKSVEAFNKLSFNEKFEIERELQPDNYIFIDENVRDYIDNNIRGKKYNENRLDTLIDKYYNKYHNLLEKIRKKGIIPTIYFFNNQTINNYRFIF